MSCITVREALELPELQALTVLAGHEGLDREVYNVTVLEIPNMFWVKRGDLILTTFYSLHGRPGAQVRLMESLSRQEIAGLCFHPSDGRVRLEPGLIQKARELSVPLMQIPREMPYATIISAVLQNIVNRQAYTLQRSSQINRILTKAVLDGADVSSLSRALARLIKMPVIAFDRGLEIITRENYNEEGTAYFERRMPDPSSWLRESDAARTEGLRLVDAADGVQVAVQPITVRKRTLGYLTAWGFRKRFEEVDLIAITHAATSMALELMRRRGLPGSGRRASMDFCYDLVSGSFSSLKTLSTRACSLGIDLSNRERVIVVDVAGTGGSAARDSVPSLRAAACDALEEYLDEQYPDTLYAVKSGAIAVVPSLPSHLPCEEWAKGFSEEIRDAISAAAEEAVVTVGIGGAYSPPLRLAQSYEEAVKALDVGKRIKGPSSVTSYNELGAYRVLSLLPRTAEVERLGAKILGSLLGEGDYSWELLDTLEAYLETSHSVARAASKLYVHPNTVKYRLHKARDLLGKELVSGDRWLETLLAIKLLKLSRGGSSS